MVPETPNQLSVKQTIEWHLLMIPVYLLLVMWVPITIMGELAERYYDFVYMIDGSIIGIVENYKRRINTWV